MITYRKQIECTSNGHRPAFHDVTDAVKDIVKESQVKNGICVVYSHHTTCSVLIQESSFDVTYNDIEFLHQDLLDMFEKLFPTCRKEGQYMHPGPQLTAYAERMGETRPMCLNTDAHLRSVLIGRSESIVVENGALDLGNFGRIYFVDFDQTRVRNRTVQVQILGE